MGRWHTEVVRVVGNSLLGAQLRHSVPKRNKEEEEEKTKKGRKETTNKKAATSRVPILDFRARGAGRNTLYDCLIWT